MRGVGVGGLLEVLRGCGLMEFVLSRNYAWCELSVFFDLFTLLFTVWIAWAEWSGGGEWEKIELAHSHGACWGGCRWTDR